MQEPKDAEAVEACVRQRYQVNFRIMEKTKINGPDTHPVYRFLRLRADTATDVGASPSPSPSGERETPLTSDPDTPVSPASTSSPSSERANPIGWNFTMFLVEPSGEKIQRFPGSRTPLSLRYEIERCLVIAEANTLQ